VESVELRSHAREEIPKTGDGSRGEGILMLGIGIQPPLQLVNQYLDTSTQPHELHLQVEGERGARYP